jgi:hypothetical protein
LLRRNLKRNGFKNFKEDECYRCLEGGSKSSKHEKESASKNKSKKEERVQ